MHDPVAPSHVRVAGQDCRGVRAFNFLSFEWVYLQVVDKVDSRDSFSCTKTVTVCSLPRPRADTKASADSDATTGRSLALVSHSVLTQAGLAGAWSPGVNCQL